jgi:hypothetical protein
MGYTDLIEKIKLLPRDKQTEVFAFVDALMTQLASKPNSDMGEAELGLDEIVAGSDPDFGDSGLKAPSVLRLSRLAVLDSAVLVGCIGWIAEDRLMRIRGRLGGWIMQSA